MHYIAGDEPALEVAPNYALEIPRAYLAAQNEPQRMARVAHEWQFGRTQPTRSSADTPTTSD